jgi:hypothetical protein
MPQSFKMALPSTIQESASNSVHGKESNKTIDEWLALSANQRSKNMSLSSATKEAPSMMNSPKREGFQNSKELCYGKTNRPMSLAQNQDLKVNLIMIQNGSKKGWFYPSKGLNELFYRAGKLLRLTLEVFCPRIQTLNPHH